MITEYIDVHYNETLTLETLTLLSYGAPYHLHRTFKKKKAITSMEYTRQTRIKKSKMILTTSDSSVAEVGESVGISNTPYFITLFKKNQDKLLKSIVG
ncbi:helix-turn-helix domain-containing protein [Paenibacillus taichungensis]|uniref:helix-turn-helix domain-containing protein n=1 Tax=Paenibacillus taichungensis TaxID=484184 RepID=UPI0035DB513D